MVVVVVAVVGGLVVEVAVVVVPSPPTVVRVKENISSSFCIPLADDTSPVSNGLVSSKEGNVIGDIM